ncbi:MAG TPA: MFS transporter [Sediminibacterium sp.]|jgi:MFS family permease|uniref:MFS transporter n=1 Tax=Sediminibacterium sp. TaxID=1917865 RepID=UPI002C5FC60D|nr:MFS transporter [Sediminibacterium sp.]HQS23000.1 MFS transporter [Sediminibacterium sp.]HQS33796.1 MFS transporter [Sediminibacterium sp.]
MESQLMNPNHRFFTFQFGLLCVSNFLFSASFNMMIPELPGYLTKIGGAEYKGLIIALFTLMAGISRPFSGKLTDTIGRVPVMVFGSLVCVICSLLYPVLTSVAGFLLLRFVHGFSTGFKPTATAAYGADVVHESRRGEAMGALAIGYTIGASAGPMLGSYLVNYFSYDIMFYVSAFLALGSVIILYNVKETLPNAARFKAMHLKINRTEIFDASAIRPALITLLLCFSIGTVLTVAPDFSEHLGLHNKGIFFAFFTVASLFIRFVAGKISDKYGRVPVLIGSTAVLVIAMIILSLSHSVTMMLVGAVLYGLSWGINSPVITAWTVDLCEPVNRGKAIASMYIALEVGIGTGALFSGWIYHNESTQFIYAFLTPAILALIACALLIRWNNKRALA